MKKDELCATIISLENEIEFLKEVKEPTIKKKRELSKLYNELKRRSTLNRGSEDEQAHSEHMAFDVSKS
jgi:hypothetical protein